MTTMKIGYFGEGKLDYILLPPLLEAIAQNKAQIHWPVEASDMKRLNIRKTGHGGVLEKIRALMEFHDECKKSLERMPESFYVIVLDRRTRTVQQMIKETMNNCSIPYVMGIAIEEIEAWILADRCQLLNWLQLDESASHVRKLRYFDSEYDPEEDSDPKKTLDQLIRASSVPSADCWNTDAAAEFVEFWRDGSMDLVEIEKGCPKGFKPFSEAVSEYFLGHYN